MTHGSIRQRAAAAHQRPSAITAGTCDKSRGTREFQRNDPTRSRALIADHRSTRSKARHPASAAKALLS